MADDFARKNVFDYRSNSNLVVEQERKGRNFREPTGEVESLVGRMAGSRMGDRVHQDRPPELVEKMARRRKRQEDEKAGKVRKKKQGRMQDDDLFVARTGNVMSETAELDTGAYRPKTRDTRVAYEGLLSFVQVCLGDQPQDILRGATDEVLGIVKNAELTGKMQHKELNSLLGPIKEIQFNKMLEMTNRITDYTGADGDEEAKGDADDDKIDEEVGVAVVFDDDEEEDESDLDEVQEGENMDEDDDESGLQEAGTKARVGRTEADDGADGDAGGAGAEGELDVNQIDAYWLQRELSKFYDDANVSQKHAEEVLRILAEPDERACENRLVVLLDFDKFELIKLLLRNRKKVLYLTRLRQAQTNEERAEVEAQMVTDVAGGGLAILEQLRHTQDTKPVHARARL